MRYASVSLTLILLLASVLSLVGCAPKEDLQAELTKVHKGFQSYFGGISKSDYQATRNACSSDYLLFEDGMI